MSRLVKAKYLYDEVDERTAGCLLPSLSVSIHHGVVENSSADEEVGESEQSSSRKMCEKDDVVLNRMRAFQGAVGISPARGQVSPDYLVLRARRTLMRPAYLAQVFRSSRFVGEMSARLRGIGGTDSGKVRTPRVNKEDLGSIEVDVPPLDEQDRRLNFLSAEFDRLDDLRSCSKKLREVLLERRRTSVFEQVTGGLARQKMPSGLMWAPHIPREWRSVKLSYLARMGSGHTPSRSRPEWWLDCDIPWITTGEVWQVRSDRTEVIFDTREKLSRLGLANSSAELCPAGTVVLCRTASAGYSAVMGAPMATSQDFVTWTCGRDLYPHYLLWVLRAMRSDLLGRLATGSTHKTIYVPDLQMLRIPLPTYREQVELVLQIRESNSEVDRMVDAIDRRISVLTERRQALIDVMIDGKADLAAARGVDS